jgi:hypothetical protein
MIFPKVKNELDRCSDMEQLLPCARLEFTEFENRCRAAGLNMKRTETFRSYKRQVQVHKDNPSGSAEPGMSMHGRRIACDYCQNIKGKEYDPAILAKAGKIWQSMGHTWGGEWGDNPHMQLVKVKDQDKVRAFKMNWDKLEPFMKSYILKARKKK